MRKIAVYENDILVKSPPVLFLQFVTFIRRKMVKQADGGLIVYGL
jgi:hypothetical protein